MIMTPQVNHFIFHVFRFAFHVFRFSWSRYDPFVVFFFLDFLTLMMIKIWNYISATLRIWEAICWMAEGGSKKRCYCRSRKRARSAAKRFARGAPFVRFNITMWQRTFDPIVKLLKFIVILSIKVFCIQTWWAGPLFDWDRWWGGKIKLKITNSYITANHYKHMMDYFILCGLNCHGNTAQVYMATTKYASEYLMQYQGHTTPVNNVKFNPFVPVSRTFLLIRWGWDRRFRRHLLQTNEKQMWYLFRFRQAACYYKICSTLLSASQR